MSTNNKFVEISDFSDKRFQAAFQQYFAELGVQVRDWDGLFTEMNEGENLALLHLSAADEVIGFLQLTTITLSSWFFDETVGFIREFWIAQPYRGQGNGSALLSAAETYFAGHGVYKAILTTDTAPGFYLKQGYHQDDSYAAKNKDTVFVKQLHH